MGCPPDERLPEVAPGQGPQALSPTEVWLHGAQLEERDPKFFVAYDDAPMQVKPDDAPKILTDDGFGSGDTPVMSALSPTGTVPWEHTSAVDSLHAGDPSTPPIEEKMTDERRICGLRRKMFFLFLGALIIIVAASVGGGVGGGLAAANARNHASASAQNSPGAVDAGSTGTTSSSTPAPTPTNLSELPKKIFYQFQGWEQKDFQGNATKIYSEDGYWDLEFEVRSWAWTPTEIIPNPNCCITFCRNRTDAGGYWCQEKRQKEVSNKENLPNGGKFGRIWTGCGDDARQQHKCSPEDPNGSDAA